MQSYKKNAHLCGIMKRLYLIIAVLMTADFAANAQWFDFSSASGSRNAYGLVLTSAQAQPYSSRQAVLGW